MVAQNAGGGVAAGGGGRWRWTVEAECSGAHNVCANYSHLLLLYTILTMHFIPKLK